MMKVALWLKISRAQIFWFCNANVTTFPTSRKCKNFSSSLYTVPAEMLYFRKYLTNSQKTFFGWTMVKVGYCGWKFQGLRCFGFAMATLQLFQHPENVKISILPFTLSQQKCYIFESIYRILIKLFLAKRWWMWLLWLENLKGSGILVLQWQPYNFSNIQKM